MSASIPDGGRAIDEVSWTPELRCHAIHTKMKGEFSEVGQDREGPWGRSRLDFFQSR